MNQNKGIGAYQKRPGYFMGGMIGGAILGALVNKIQGKDWKRGALFGGITGGFMGSSHMAGVLGKMKPGLMKSLLTTGGTQYGGTAALSPLAKYGIPAAVTYMAGDPEYDKKKMDEAMTAESEERKRKNMEMYPDWYKNFFPGFFNRGGMIDGRLGYYDGGPAGGAYSDVPMEESGPTMDPEIMRLPMGQEGTFEEENEGILGLELAGLSDSERAELQGLMSLRLITPKDDPKYPQIEMRIQELMEGISAQTGRSIGPAGASTVSDDGTRMMAMSEPHPDEGYYDMFFDEKGRYPKDREELDIFLEGMDLDSFQAADGGLMRLHAKDGLWANIHAKRKRIKSGSGETMRSPGSAGAPTDEALRESQATGGIMGYYGGGMSDMDLTQGGASFGPGTGTSDDIPAMLSDGEFVVTAKAVENLGGGNRMLGAKKMYQMMNQLDPNSQTPAEMDTTGIA
jgi:hypothetical protein